MPDWLRNECAELERRLERIKADHLRSFNNLNRCLHFQRQQMLSMDADSLVPTVMQDWAFQLQSLLADPSSYRFNTLKQQMSDAQRKTDADECLMLEYRQHPALAHPHTHARVHICTTCTHACRYQLQNELQAKAAEVCELSAIVASYDLSSLESDVKRKRDELLNAIVLSYGGNRGFSNESMDLHAVPEGRARLFLQQVERLKYQTGLVCFGQTASLATEIS